MAIKNASSVTSKTADNMIIGAGNIFLNLGLPNERLLGATRGGSTFNPGVSTRDIEVDSLFTMNKGLRALDDMQPKISTTLLEMTFENFLLAIPGARELTPGDTYESIKRESLGAGDGTKVLFPLAHDKVSQASIFAFDAATGKYTRVTGYSILNIGDTGHSGGAVAEAVFTTPPTAVDAPELLIGYRRLRGDLDGYRAIVGGEIGPDSYFENVSLVATINNQKDPSIFQLFNAIPETTQDLSFVNKGEAVLPITWSGTYDSCGDGELWNILHPKIVSTSVC